MTPQEAASSFFRRAGMSDMRKMDAEMYVVLAMRWAWEAGLGAGIFSVDDALVPVGLK